MARRGALPRARSFFCAFVSFPAGLFFSGCVWVGWAGVEWVFFSCLFSLLASFRSSVLACLERLSGIVRTVPLPNVFRSLIQELLESFDARVFLISGFCFYLVRSLAWRVNESTPKLGTATRTERLRVSLSNRSCGSTFAFKNQGACLSSLRSAAPRAVIDSARATHWSDGTVDSAAQ